MSFQDRDPSTLTGPSALYSSSSEDCNRDKEALVSNENSDSSQGENPDLASRNTVQRRLENPSNFVERLYTAYKEEGPNSVVELHQRACNTGNPPKFHFLKQYDIWEAQLKELKEEAIGLDDSSTLRLLGAFDRIAPDDKDWTAEEHKQLFRLVRAFPS